MKRIAFIQHCGTVGGSGLGLLTTAIMLKDRFDIIVYCPDKPDDLRNRFISEGITVKSFPAALPTYGYFNGGPALLTNSCYSAVWDQKECIDSWKRELSEMHVDVMLVNSLVLSWMYKCVEGTSCKTICHVREVLRSKKTLLGKRIINELNHFDQVWYISEYELKKHALSKPHTAIVRDCVIDNRFSETDTVNPAREDKADFVLLYVGGVSPLKGFPTLVKASKHFSDSVKVQIAGYLTVQKPRITLGNIIYFNRYIKYLRLKKMAEEAMAQKNIEVLGFCSDLREVYSNCNALVFPSKYAHQARPAFEAGFFGKPVIISNFPDTRDSIIDGENGIVFKPNSSLDLAKKVNYLANNKEYCSLLGQKNKEMANTFHTFDAVMETVISCIEELS